MFQIVKKDSALNRMEIVVDNDVGRHVIAKRIINEGELILKCDPLSWIVNPMRRNKFCDWCWTTINDQAIQKKFRCSNCLICFYCSQKCRNAAFERFHSKIECYSFKMIMLRLSYAPRAIQLTEMILLISLRTLFSTKEKEKQEEKQEEQEEEEDFQNDWQSFSELVSNRNDKDILQQSLRQAAEWTVSNLFKDENFNNCLNLVEPKEFQKTRMTFDCLLETMLKIQCNSFGKPNENEQDQCSVLAVYVKASCFNHSCLPNLKPLMRGKTATTKTTTTTTSTTMMTMIENKRCLEVFALEKIEKGNELAIPYLDCRKTSGERKTYLKRYYYFDCNCVRCGGAAENSKDNEEKLFSYYSCSFCARNSGGMMVPIIEKEESGFIFKKQCNICGNTILISK